MYFVGQEGGYGDDFYTGPSTTNVWDCMEMQIKLNSRHPNPVQSDGVLRVWRNDQLYVQIYNRYTNLPYGIQDIWWNIYHGGSSKLAPVDVIFDFDNVVAATKRIGCY